MPLSPFLQSEASPNLRLGGAGLKPHKRVWEIVADAVVLGREVVRLGLSVPANQRGLRRILVHVVGN